MDFFDASSRLYLEFIAFEISEDALSHFLVQIGTGAGESRLRTAMAISLPGRSTE
jgi:hypothetical protein